MVFQASGRQLTRSYSGSFQRAFVYEQGALHAGVVAASAPKRCSPTIKLKAVDTVQIVAFKTGSASLPPQRRSKAPSSGRCGKFEVVTCRKRSAGFRAGAGERWVSKRWSHVVY